MTRSNQPPEERMSDDTTIDVGSWFATLARAWWVIVGLVVIGVVAGAVVTLAQPDEYTATASVYIGQTTDANGNAMAGLNSNAKAAVQLLSSQVALNEAAKRTGMGISAGRLRKETTIETPSSTVKTSTSVVNIIVISVTDTDPERAAAAANALAEVLLDKLESSVDEKIAQGEFRELLEKKFADFSETLSEREREILSRRLIAEDPETLQQIADRYGISREAIRVAEKKLIAKLKQYMIDSFGDVREIEFHLAG